MGGLAYCAHSHSLSKIQHVRLIPSKKKIRHQPASTSLYMAGFRFQWVVVLWKRGHFVGIGSRAKYHRFSHLARPVGLSDPMASGR